MWVSRVSPSCSIGVLYSAGQREVRAFQPFRARNGDDDERVGRSPSIHSFRWSIVGRVDEPTFESPEIPADSNVIQHMDVLRLDDVRTVISVDCECVFLSGRVVSHLHQDVAEAHVTSVPTRDHFNDSGCSPSCMRSSAEEVPRESNIISRDM